MKISVKAKPKSKKEFVKRMSVSSYIVSVTEPAEKGQANAAIAKALAKYFKVPKSALTLISGQTSKQKVFEIALELEEIEDIPDQSGQIKMF